MQDVVVVVGGAVVVVVAVVGGGAATGAVVVVELPTVVGVATRTGDVVGVVVGTLRALVFTDALVTKPCPGGAVGTVSCGTIVVVVAVLSWAGTGMVTGPRPC
jgi:hypothetical protein